MNDIEKKMVDFVNVCLNDDDGISEDAYGKLLDLCHQGSAEFGEALDFITQHTDGCNGRVYLKK